MIGHEWRAGEVVVPDGVIALDVSGSGRVAKRFVRYESGGLRRELHTVGELADVFHSSAAPVEHIARTDPFGLAYLLCVLSGRPHHVPPSETLWPRLEGFGLTRAEGAPRVEVGQLTLVVYSIPVPELRLSRLWVDLTTLDVREEVLANLPWPLVPAAV